MPEFFQVVEQFQITSPRDTLRQIATHRKNRRSNDVPLPLVTIYCRDGHSFSGTVVGIKEEAAGQEEYLLLHCQDRPSQDAVVVLSLSQVAAVQIHRAFEVAPLFTGSRWPVRPPVSRLELRRSLESQSKQLTEMGLSLCLDVDWDSVPAEGNLYGVIQDCMAEVMKAVESSGQDDMGKEAWKKWEKLKLMHADLESPGLETLEKQLLLKINLYRELPLGLAERLGELFNSVL
jgi:hypothetical protein